MARGAGSKAETFDLSDIVRGGEDDSFSDLRLADLASQLREAQQELVEVRAREALLTDLAQKDLLTICRDCEDKPAEYIFWGKLFPAEVLGPRCYDCARKHVNGATLADVGSEGRHPAVIDLRPYNRLFDRY
jgi:hypothetical protein